HRVRRPGPAAHHPAHRRDDAAGQRRGPGGGDRPGRADRRGPAGGADRGPAHRGRAAVLRDRRAPRHAGGGVHGADPGRGRVRVVGAGRAAGSPGGVMTEQPGMSGTPEKTGTPGYRSTVPSRGDGFAAVLRAEWTKFRSVRSTVACLGLALVLTVLLSVLNAFGSHIYGNDG